MLRSFLGVPITQLIVGPLRCCFLLRRLGNPCSGGFYPHQDSNQTGDSAEVGLRTRKCDVLRLSGCFAQSFHVAQPCYDLVPTRNALGRQKTSRSLPFLYQPKSPLSIKRSRHPTRAWVTRFTTTTRSRHYIGSKSASRGAARRYAEMTTRQMSTRTTV